MNKMIKENLTKQNKEKIINILQDKMKQNFKIVKDKNEPENLQQILKELQLKYTIKNNKVDNETLKKYFETTFKSNLQQFLKEKGYNLTKSPLYKVENKNNEVSFGFLNLMEVDNMNTILSNKMIKELEQHLLNKLKLFFNLDLKVENKENLTLNNNLKQKQQLKLK